MKNNLLDFYRRYREPIDYIFFGGLTTGVNLVVFFLLDTVLGMPYLIANAVAIILSILFAYVTNKLYVFQSTAQSRREHFYEFSRFIGLRLLSGLFDMLAMWLLVDFLLLDTNLAKVFTQFIVVVLNYVFSKFFIFL